MNTMHRLRIEAAKEHRRLSEALRNDPPAYTEAVAKTNLEHIGELMGVPCGDGTVLRVFFGATERMPLRALGYITAACQIARHVPHEQLQFIFVNKLGQDINDLPLSATRRQAQLLSRIGRRFIAMNHPELQAHVLFAEDGRMSHLARFRPSMETMLASNPDAAQALARKAAGRRADGVLYAAAHVLHQETDLLALEPLNEDEPEPAVAKRICNIGGQSERLFHGVRMIGRTALAELDIEPIASMQVFTRHQLPPYFMARGGEQSLEQALTDGVNLDVACDPAARRDVLHLAKIDALEVVCNA